jgi:hypothetical protein
LCNTDNRISSVVRWPKEDAAAGAARRASNDIQIKLKRHVDVAVRGLSDHGGRA